FRPADATEAVEAWRAAMQYKDGPVAFVMARQKLPTLDRTKVAPASGPQGVAQGAYVLAEASGGAPKLLLLATGSEVQLALDARDKLEGEGIPTRVVSMPSWEVFDRQPQEVRE